LFELDDRMPRSAKPHDPTPAHRSEGDTKERILAAAEELFSRDGFDRASLRSITAAAGANIAAVNYHFGSKNDLIKAVFARRLGPINARRLARLDEAESRAAGGAPALEEVLEAFVGPPLRLAGAEPEARDAARRLLGQVLSRPDERVRQVFTDQFSEVVRRFTAALSRALPAVPESELFWRLLFGAGAMVHIMCMAPHLEAVSGGRCRVEGPEEMIARLVPFLAAGMRTPAEARKGAR
jgi:AcrR family transcriptional regulator